MQVWSGEDGVSRRKRWSGKKQMRVGKAWSFVPTQLERCTITIAPKTTTDKPLFCTLVLILDEDLFFEGMNKL
jgi:hypothetical protein